MSASISPNRTGTLMMASLQEIDKQWSRALMTELGPHLCLHINLHKCELFSRNGNSVKFSSSPNMIILGSPLWSLSIAPDFLQRDALTLRFCLEQ